MWLQRVLGHPTVQPLKMNLVKGPAFRVTKLTTVPSKCYPQLLVACSHGSVDTCHLETLHSGSSLFKKGTSFNSLPRTCCVPLFGFYMDYTDSIIYNQSPGDLKGKEIGSILDKNHCLVIHCYTQFLRPLFVPRNVVPMTCNAAEWSRVSAVAVTSP